jgi:hypothetical protein
LPAATPLTYGGVIVATDVLLLLHAPPPVLTVTRDDVPEHITTEFVAVGVTLTVTFFVLTQPLTVYDTVVIPAERPERIPVPEPIVAAVVLLLLHVPPASVFVKVIDEVAHTLTAPPITAGSAETVTIAVV